MTDKIRIGVLGLGRIGRIHADNIAHFVPRAQLAALGDCIVTDESRAFVESLEAKLYSNPLELLHSGDIDAVAICSPTDTHADLVIEAAAAGKHIFCEKPIDLTIAKVEKALAAVEKAGVKFQVGFNQRFDHNFRAVKVLSNSGKLGRLTMLSLISRDPAPPPVSYIKVSGGIFADMMIHDFDMARFQMASEITEVTSTAYALDPEIGAAGDVDTAIVSLKFENGAIGVISNSRTNACGYDQRIEVFGTKGNATIGNDSVSSVKLWDDSGIAAEKPLPFFLERYKQAYINEMIAFCDAVIDCKNVPVTGRDGLEDLRVALAATKSWKEERTVKVREIG